MTSTSTTYKEAGVDIGAADRFLAKIKPFIEKTRRPGVLTSIGHYAALFAPPKGYREPILCASTDGVGTKLKLALKADRLEGLGQDLVAMSANDILCLGAEPLFFLDYYATGHLRPEKGARILKGIARACASIHCAVIGGETAEMPSVYKDGEFDLAGFMVGIVEKKKIIDGRAIRAGDRILGLASSGPHSNGFSLIRKIFQERRLHLNKRYPPLTRPLGEMFLKPTRLYVRSVLKVARELPIHGIAHITGGGFENIPRILPKGLKAVVDTKAWPLPPLFRLLKRWGNLREGEMRRVFNLGIGLVLVVPERFARKIQARLTSQGEKVWRIGWVKKRGRGQARVEFV